MQALISFKILKPLKIEKGNKESKSTNRELFVVTEYLNDIISVGL